MASEPSTKRAKSCVQVLVNGLPGNMGREIAQACLRSGLEVLPFALTGPGMPADVTVVEDGKSVKVELSQVGDAAKAKLESMLKASSEAGKTVIAIDFTHPSAVNSNADLYTSLKLPFVMGTTGGDRDLLQKVVKESGTYALIAPNMCKQIVALQAMMEYMSSQFPAAFRGYALDIVESHQSGKADTSGTAKAMLKYFNELKGGTPLPVEDIKKLRTAQEQTAFGVPGDSLSGHAWHTYTLRSGDGSVMFQFKHNVNGRRTYAEGVVDAVNYLAAKILDNAEQRQYNMIDVLRAGAMRE